MFKNILISLLLFFIIGCGGGGSSSDTNTPRTETESNQTELTFEELNNVGKLSKAATSLDLNIILITDVVNVVGGEDSVSFNKSLYLLEDINKQLAVISLASKELEILESKQALVLKSKNIILPHFDKGYRNIVMDNNTTKLNIESELTTLFENGSVPVMSYVLSSLEKNSTIKIEGDSNLFDCTNELNKQSYEVTAVEGTLALPANTNGHYVCLDQYENKAFDYNVSISEIEDVAGSLYTFDSKVTKGVSVKIYDEIVNKVNIEALEQRLKDAKILSENGSLKLEIFYEDTNNKGNLINTVKGKSYFLEEGSYNLTYRVTAPNNETINQAGSLSSLQIVPKTVQTVITPF